MISGTGSPNLRNVSKAGRRSARAHGGPRPRAVPRSLTKYVPRQKAAPAGESTDPLGWRRLCGPNVPADRVALTLLPTTPLGDAIIRAYESVLGSGALHYAEETNPARHARSKANEWLLTYHDASTPTLAETALGLAIGHLYAALRIENKDLSPADLVALTLAALKDLCRPRPLLLMPQPLVLPPLTPQVAERRPRGTWDTALLMLNRTAQVSRSMLRLR